MAYTKVTPSSLSDLMVQLDAWLQTQGWTEHFLAEDLYSGRSASPCTEGRRLHMSKGGIYVNFRTMDAGFPTSVYQNNATYAFRYAFGCNISSGFNASARTLEQPGAPLDANGAPTAAFCYDLQNINSAYFFSLGTFVAVVVEAPTGTWQPLILGDMLPYYTIAPCRFFAGPRFSYNCPSATQLVGYKGFLGRDNNGLGRTMVWGNIEGTGAKWYIDGSTTGLTVTNMGSLATPLVTNLEASTTSNMDRGTLQTELEYLLRASNPTFTQLQPIWPVSMAIFDGDTIRPFGELPYVRLLRMENVTPETILEIGSTQYILLPLYRQDLATPNYCLFGIAIQLE